MRRQIRALSCLVLPILFPGCTSGGYWATHTDGSQVLIFQTGGDSSLHVDVKVCMNRSRYTLNVWYRNTPGGPLAYETLPESGGCALRKRPYAVWVQKGNDTEHESITGSYTIALSDAAQSDGTDALITIPCSRFTDTTGFWWGHCDVPETVANRRLCVDTGFVRTGNQQSKFGNMLRMVLDTALYRQQPTGQYDTSFNPLIAGGCRHIYNVSAVGVLIPNDPGGSGKPDALRILVRALSLRRP